MFPPFVNDIMRRRTGHSPSLRNICRSTFARGYGILTCSWVNHFSCERLSVQHKSFIIKSQHKLYLSACRAGILSLYGAEIEKMKMEEILKFLQRPLQDIDEVLLFNSIEEIAISPASCERAIRRIADPRGNGDRDCALS